MILLLGMKKRKNKNKQLLRLAGKFEPFEFGYLLKIEKQALKQMQKYFQTADISVNDEKIARQLKWAIKLLNIADETESAWKCSGDLFIDNNGVVGRNPNYKSWITTYVNTHNWKRFIPNHNNLKEPDWTNVHMQDHLRQEKAWYIYNRLRYLYGFRWWN